MAAAAGRYELLHRLLLLLPEIQDSKAASVTISFRRKAVYTAVSLVIFLVAGQLPLYGVRSRYGYDKEHSFFPDPFYWINCMFASSRHTLMSLGIVPLLVSELLIRVFLALRIIRPAVLDRPLMNRARKLFAIAMAMVMAVSSVLSTGIASVLGTMAALLVMFQLFFGGIIAIYLDELLHKGYGLLSGISLFTAANCCACIFWKAFTAEDFLLNLVATIIFFRIVLKLQCCHITLPPVRSPDDPTLQITYTINPSYMAYVPIILQPALFSFPLTSISQTLSIKYGETNNKVVNLLGKWTEMCKYPGRYVPVAGIASYITTPPSFGEIVTADLDSLLYAVFLLIGCALLSVFCFRVCATSSKRYLIRLVGKPQRTRVSLDEQLPDDDDSISPKQCRRYMSIAAIFVGFCVGVLTLLAGFLGLDGPAMMLAVTVIHSAVQGRNTDEIGAFGL